MKKSPISDPRSPISSAGFTLVEMIVSLALFTIVAVVALTALLKIIDANDKAQTVQNAVTSLSFSLDTLSRDLRSGSTVICQPGTSFTPSASMQTAGCQLTTQVSGPLIIAFQSSQIDNSNSQQPCRLWYAYRFTPTAAGVTLAKAEQTADGKECLDVLSDAASSFTPIVPTSVTLSSYEVAVAYNSTTQPDPLVFIQLAGSAGTKEATKTYFTLQTAASPRTP